MKRFAAFLLTLAVVLSIMPAVSFADTFDPNSITSPNVLLMDASSGAVLFEKNARTRAYPASTTKIMTCILALENCPDLDVVVTIGDNVETKGSRMKFSRGEQLTLRALIYGMMLNSGNDAAKAIAEHISGSESAFAELMNQKAASLGMTGTHFVKPNGLHNDDHYSTAYDMAILTRYALQNEEFRTIVAAETYQVPPTNKDSDGYLLENTNKLIHTKDTDEQSYKYSYATGVKTGDTNEAGRCLVASAKKNGVELIAVIFGDPQGSKGANLRFTNSVSLFEWGFENYASLDAAALGLEAEFTFSISGAEDVTEITAHANLTGAYITDTKEKIAAIQANPAAITAQTALSGKVEAPIAAGDVIGTVAYQYESATLFSVDLIADQDVAAAAVEATPNPSANPLFVDTPGVEHGDADKGSPWLFWLLIAVVVLIVILVVRGIAAKRRRRRLARRRRAYRANYNVQSRPRR